MYTFHDGNWRHSFHDDPFVPSFIPRLDQFHETVNASVTPSLGYQYAQIIAPTISGLLRYVELNLKVCPIEPCNGRVLVYDTVCGLPSLVGDDIVARSVMAENLTDGWNRFYFTGENVPLTAGRQYAIILETTSLCEWRIQFGTMPTKGRSFCQRWNGHPWEVVKPAATAAFRTYMEGFRSAAFPSCR